MKTNFKFSNLCGTYYVQGNIVFSRDGDRVFSPVGNRVSVFDLKNNKSKTFAFSTRKNLESLALSPDDSILLAVDEDGSSVVFNLKTEVATHFFNFKAPVKSLSYSPNGKYIAATHGRKIKVWIAPGTSKSFQPFVLVREYAGFFSDVTCLSWSSDSRFFAAGSEDMSTKVFSVHPMEQFGKVSLSGHRDAIVGCFFVHNSLDLYTVSADGALFAWKCDMPMASIKEKLKKRKNEEEPIEKEEPQSKDDKAFWEKTTKHFFNQEHARVTCVDYHQESHVLVTGFSTGTFILHELPDFTEIHSLSINQNKIDSVTFNPTGEWLAFGSSALNQLVVWEWQSETYVLKQQGHFYNLGVLAYSPDGKYIATGGDDSKVKIWNVYTGFCFVTFAEHTAAVTGVVFNHNGHVVVTASLDGSVRCFDLNRYRNFRTFTSPRPAQFFSLALDASSEIVCAGSLDSFEIFVWSVQTGRLLEVLAGHEGPVSCLAFMPNSAMLLSGSWDGTVRVWDVVSQSAAKNVLRVGCDVFAVACRPDAGELAVASIDGQITFWHVEHAIQVGSIEGRNDLGAGRSAQDQITAKESIKSKYFTCISYSADGQCIMAGGKSKFVCVYNVPQKVLLKKFTISNNKSLDGVQDILNSELMTEAGPIGLLDTDHTDNKDHMPMPGSIKANNCKRKGGMLVQTRNLQLSPTGRSWAAATTDGLLIFSLDLSMSFLPTQLDIDITPQAILDALHDGRFTNSLRASLKLNEKNLIIKVLESIQITDIATIAASLPFECIERLLVVIGNQVEQSGHLEFYLEWCNRILVSHGNTIKTYIKDLNPTLLLLQRNLVNHANSVGKLCDTNTYDIRYALLHFNSQQEIEGM